VLCGLLLVLCTQANNMKRDLHCRVICVVYTDLQYEESLTLSSHLCCVHRLEYKKRLILHTCTDSRVTTELRICAEKRKRKKGTQLCMFVCRYRATETLSHASMTNLVSENIV